MNLGAALLMGLGICACNRPPAPVPSPTPPPTVTPALTVAPAPTATPVPENIPAYNGAQQMEYIKTAQSAFIEIIGNKSLPFTEANNAYLAAGGASVKGLTSKEAIVERRALIEKVRQANADYMVFAATQDNTYREELAKTPLSKGDVESLVAEYAARAKLDKVKKLREGEAELMKAADVMMVYLDKKFGTWRVDGVKPVFKRAEDGNPYGELGKKYNVIVAQLQQLQSEINAPLPTAGETPIPSIPPSPAGGPAPASPTAAPKPSPAR